MIPKLKIVALEISHSQGEVISGGDKLLEEMSAYLSPNISLEIIIPKIASWHWRGRRATILTLKKTVFERHQNIFALTIAYVLRIIQTITILLSKKEKFVIYSSTNIFPDVLPAALVKSNNSQTFWFGRIHHLIPPPQNRPGNFIINTFSFLTQEISLLLLKRADRIAVLNNKLIPPLLKKGFKKSKLFVLPAGIEPKKWRFEKTTKRYDAVFLGRLHPAKGVNDLIPLWNTLCQKLPRAKLLVIGQGHRKTIQKLKKESQKTGVGDNIKISGPVPQNKIRSIFLDSKIFLFLDHEAGFGIAPLEAMSCGLPIVGYDIGILGETFKKGFIKVKPYDINLFSKVLVKLLSNPHLFESISSEAREESKSHSWSKIARSFQNHLPPT